jgi:hypothetical protein
MNQSELKPISSHGCLCHSRIGDLSAGNAVILAYKVETLNL